MRQTWERTKKEGKENKKRVKDGVKEGCRSIVFCSTWKFFKNEFHGFSRCILNWNYMKLSCMLVQMFSHITGCTVVIEVSIKAWTGQHKYGHKKTVVIESLLVITC